MKLSATSKHQGTTAQHERFAGKAPIVRSAKRRGKRRVILASAVALLGVMVGVIAVRHWMSPRGPMYKGKAVSEWVTAYLRKTSHVFSISEIPGEQEFLPILQIGSNAVPYLVSAIEQKPGFIAGSFYSSLYRNLPARLHNKLPSPVRKEFVRLRAFGALEALGPTARSAVPFLARQFKATNSELDTVHRVLVAIGPEAKEAIPVLADALHGSDQMFRLKAARTLVQVDANNSELIAAMLSELKSTNAVARRVACVILREMGPPARKSIAALKHAWLNDEDKAVRDNAYKTLLEIQ